MHKRSTILAVKYVTPIEKKDLKGLGGCYAKWGSALSNKSKGSSINPSMLAKGTNSGITLHPTLMHAAWIHTIPVAKAAVLFLCLRRYKLTLLSGSKLSQITANTFESTNF